MIIEKKNILHWKTFPDCAVLKPGLRSVYQSSKCKKYLFTHIRLSFATMELDLSKGESDLLAQYKPVVRREIRRAEGESLRLWFDEDYCDLIELFQDTIAAKGLQPMGPFTFKGKNNLVIGHVVHPEFGTISAQAYSADIESGRVLFLYNASAYRRFERGSFARALCGRANRLLLHRALVYFKTKGFLVFDVGGYQIGGLEQSRKSVDQYKGKLGGKPVVLYNYYPVWYYLFRELRFAWMKISRP